LDPEELAEFRAWFAEYDWGIWDQQLDRDANIGKLDRLDHLGSQISIGLNVDGLIDRLV